MKRCCLFLILCFALPAFGLAGGMERAIVHVMRKVPCEGSAAFQAPPMGMGGVQAGTSTGGDCLEYELRTKKVSYVVRPHKQVLLMVGEEVTIRLAISELLVSSPGLPREVKCSVHSMVLLSEAERNDRRQQQQQPVILRCYDNGQAVPCPRE